MAYNQTLGYDPDIADYSLLIAGTKDRQAREELLRQRQNKLDHLQAQGAKNPDWASNQTVSGWDELSQPGGWNNATAAYNAYGGTVGGAARAPATSGAGGLQTSALQSRYEEAAAAQQQALQRAVELEAGRLGAQKKAATADYEAMARQAYIQYMRDLQALPAALSRHGLQGGVTESALTALGTAYQENLYQGDLAQRRAQEQLDAAIAELRARGGIEAAQTAAENAARQAEALQSLYRSLLEEQRWQQQFDFTAQQQAQRQEQGRQQLAAEAEQQDYRRRLEVARLQAAAGDFSGYRALGIDTAAMERTYGAQQAAKAGDAARRSVSPAEAPAEEAAQPARDSAAVRPKTALTPLERSALTYVEELSALYVRNGQKMRDQIAEDLDQDFISAALAGKALALIRGDWRVVEG